MVLAFSKESPGVTSETVFSLVAVDDEDLVSALCFHPLSLDCLFSAPFICALLVFPEGMNEFLLFA